MAYLDKMSVMIGTPGKETAQDAVRVTSNGHGDKTGPLWHNAIHSARMRSWRSPSTSTTSLASANISNRTFYA